VEVPSDVTVVVDGASVEVIVVVDVMVGLTVTVAVVVAVVVVPGRVWVDVAVCV
jgi:hypothetical protein